MCDVNYLKDCCNEVLDVFWEDNEVIVLLDNVTDQVEDKLYCIAPALPLHLITAKRYEEIKHGIRSFSETIDERDTYGNSCLCR